MSRAPARSSFSMRTSPRLLLALLLLVTALVYAPAMRGGFVYDDHRLVERNPLVVEGSAADAFTTDLSGGGGWQIYRPLVALSFQLDHALFGLRPLGFHLVNLLWHLVAVLALAALVRSLVATLGPPGGDGSLAALLAAGLFALHPVQSEAVIWISRRADVMGGALALAALLAFTRWRGHGRPVDAIAGILLVGLALLAKEIAVAVPFLVVLLLLLPARARDGAPALRSRITVSALAVLWLAPYVATRIALFGTATGQPTGVIQNLVVGLDGPERAATVLALVGRYAALVVAPRELAADYSWRSIPPASGILDPWTLAGIATLLLVGAMALVTWRRRPEVTVATGLLVATTVPISNAVVEIGTAFAERLLYLPVAGIAIAAGIGGAALARRRPRWGTPALVVLLLALGARTAMRGPDWRDDRSLFASVLTVNPENVVALTYVAIAEADAGRVDAARARYRTALEVEPDYHLARVNLAEIHLREGDADEAARLARYVVERDPGPGAAHLTLGRAELARGNPALAIEELRAATRDPRTRVNAWIALGDLHLAGGNGPAARRALDRARALAPDHPGVRALAARLGR